MDEVIGDRAPGMEELKQLRFTTRVICEAMRLYPPPPILIRWPTCAMQMAFRALFV